MTDDKLANASKQSKPLTPCNACLDVEACVNLRQCAAKIQWVPETGWSLGASDVKL